MAAYIIIWNFKKLDPKECRLDKNDVKIFKYINLGRDN